MSEVPATVGVIDKVCDRYQFDQRRDFLGRQEAPRPAARDSDQFQTQLFHRHCGYRIELRQDFQCLYRGGVCDRGRWLAGGEAWQSSRQQSLWQRGRLDRARRQCVLIAGNFREVSE